MSSPDGLLMSTQEMSSKDLQPALRHAVSRSVKLYLKDMNGYNPHALYQQILAEVEAPLLREVLDHSGGNRSRAAEILGLNRGTLRKKIEQYRLD